MRQLFLIAIAFVGALLLTTTAFAEPLYLFGEVGRAPVLVTLERKGDELSGWYIYLRQAREIRLEGKAGPANAFRFEEFDADTHRKSGDFTGNASGQTWSGVWRKPDGKDALSFVLHENRDSLGTLDTKIRCETKKLDTKYGYTYKHSLNLEIVHGAVKGLETQRGETSSDGDEQSCSLSLSDLKQTPSATGILLRSKSESVQSELHCSVRILAAGDYVYVQIGDSAEANNDCRGSSDAMFCSPRSFWTNMVANRKTQVCRSEE